MKTLQAIWRRITTTRFARALEEQILPHMRAQEAELARLHAEVTRQRADNDRLRAENRALLNSILGIAGVPPILVGTAPDSGDGSSGYAFKRTDNESLSAAASAAEGSGAKVAEAGTSPSARPSHPRSAQVVAPTRRRSWPQIHRALEIAAAQNKHAHEDILV